MARLLLAALFAVLVILHTASGEDAGQSGGKLRKKKVLIVGGGINGAATAYFIKQLSRGTLPASAFGDSSIGQHDADSTNSNEVEITIAEASDRLGGRVYAERLPTGHFVEIGGSVYHKVNKYVAGFHKAANLTKSHPYSSGRVGLFSAKERVFKFAESTWSSLFTMVKAVWRYGLNPISALSYVDQAVDKLDKLYNMQLNEGRTFQSAEDFLETLDLKSPTHVSLQSLLNKNASVSGVFLPEFVHAFTRINYGQSLEIGGLAGLVAMKGRGDEVFSAAEGNDAAVKFLVKQATTSDGGDDGGDKGGHVLFNTPLTIHGLEGGEECIRIEGLERDIHFDVIVLAYPQPQRGRYKMKVTQGTWITGTLNNSFFGYQKDDVLPTAIIPIGEEEEEEDNDKDHHPQFALPFRHIGLVKGSTNVYKLFSDDRLTASQLEETGAFLPGTVTVLSEKKWEAYPVLEPRDPDEQHHHFQLASKKAVCGRESAATTSVFNANALEYAVSTMETQSMAGMNTALLVLKDLGIKVISRSPQQQQVSVPPADGRGGDEL